MREMKQGEKGDIFMMGKNVERDKCIKCLIVRILADWPIYTDFFEVPKK